MRGPERLLKVAAQVQPFELGSEGNTGSARTGCWKPIRSGRWKNLDRMKFTGSSDGLAFADTTRR